MVARKKTSRRGGSKQRTFRSWQVLLTVAVPRLFISQRALLALSRKILRLAEVSCHRSYLPPKVVNTLSLVICTDKQIHKLNKHYRGKDKPTDVLSFSQIEGEASYAPAPILGDIVISIDTLKRQAIEYQVSNHEELCRLLIHGVLHLFGYDHENVSKIERLKMESLEDVIRLSL